MERVTFAEFCKTTGVTAVSPVRTNVNNYPFVTLLRGDDAENIYFSKNASANVDAGTAIASIAKDIYVVDTLNAAGEARQKLSFKGDSPYTDIADLF